MTSSLSKKVAVRLEYTGQAAQDRAQRMAQQVGQAHEATKSVVEALANHTFTRLSTDNTLATSATYATLLTTTITTKLSSGNILITATASGQKITAVGTAYFRLLVDNVAAKGVYTTSQAVPNAWSISIVHRVAATRGAHTVALQWRTDSNSLRINASSVTEEHASLLVQEVA